MGGQALDIRFLIDGAIQDDPPGNTITEPCPISRLPFGSLPLLPTTAKRDSSDQTTLLNCLVLGPEAPLFFVLIRKL